MDIATSQTFCYGSLFVNWIIIFIHFQIWIKYEIIIFPYKNTIFIKRGKVNNHIWYYQAFKLLYLLIYWIHIFFEMWKKDCEKPCSCQTVVKLRILFAQNIWWTTIWKKHIYIMSIDGKVAEGYRWISPIKPLLFHTIFYGQFRKFNTISSQKK